MLRFKEYLGEDLAGSDIKVKKWVDGNGITRTRKYRARRIDFAASKGQSAPSQDDEPLK